MTGRFRFIRTLTAWDRAYLAPQAVVVGQSQALDALARLRPGYVEVEEQPSTPVSDGAAAEGWILSIAEWTRFPCTSMRRGPLCWSWVKTTHQGWRASAGQSGAHLSRELQLPGGRGSGAGLVAWMIFRRDRNPAAKPELPS
jgi:hypothetical protein